MTTIHRLTTEGLRARDHEVSLSALNLVRGPVGSGKTSITDAIRILAVGSVPSIGKDSTAVSRLMRGRALRVRAELDDGRVLERGYDRKGARLQQVAESTDMPPRSKLTDITESIRSLFGRDDREAVEHVDLRQLLSASPNARAARIEELLDASGLGVAEAMSRAYDMTILRLAGIDREKMPEDDGGLAKAAEGATALLEMETLAALELVREMCEEHAKGGGIIRALADASDQKKNAAASVRRQVSARAEMEDRVAELRAPADALEVLEARRDAALERKAAAERDLEAAREAAEVRAEVEPALPGLRQSVEEAEGALLAAKEKLPRAEEALAEAESIEDPDPVPAIERVEPDADALAEARGCAEEAKELTAKADAIEIPDPILTDAAEATLIYAEGRVTSAEGSPWREVERIADRLDEVNGREDADQRDVESCADDCRRLALEHAGDLEALRKDVEDARLARDRAQRDARERADEISQRKLTREGLRANAKDLRERAESIEAEARKVAEDENARRMGEYDTACRAREDEARRVKLQRKALREEAESIRTAASEAQTKLDAARAALREAEAKLAGIDSVKVDTAKAEAVVAAAESDIASTKEQLAALRGAQSLREEMRRLIAEIDRLTAEQKAWAAAEWALNTVRAMDLQSRAAGLENRMRRYLRAGGIEDEPYLRSDGKICDFGVRRAGQEVSVEALSGGESVAFCAALAGAVLALRGPELRILMIEGNEVGTGPEAGALFAMCEEMVGSGDIAQVLCASNLPLTPGESWNVIEVRAASEVAA